MSAERILVTGATGFVGRHLVPHLLTGERHLTLAVRNARNCPAAWRDDQRLRLVEIGPIETATNLEDAIANVATVIHLAGQAQVRLSDAVVGDQPHIDANSVATKRLTEAAARGHVKTFVHMSSLFAVTDNVSATVVDDDTERMPSTAYGRSKRAAEAHVRRLADKGVLGVSLRPPLIIGADAKGNWKLLQTLAASGIPLPFASVNNRRSLIAVDSVVQAIAHLCLANWPAEKSGAYCLADREAISLAGIVRELRTGMQILPRLVPIPPRLIAALATLAGRREQVVNALLGDLEVDARRFCETFGFYQLPRSAESVRRSGMLYSKDRAR